MSRYFREGREETEERDAFRALLSADLRRGPRKRSVARSQPDFVYPPMGCETVPPGFQPGYIQIFDDDPVSIGERCGELGPTHLARFREPEYDYQLQIMFEDLLADYPRSVRAVAPDGRVWTKRAGRFVRRAR